MAFYFVPTAKTSSATGFINLARNVGASTGISFVTTMLDRRAQFHQNVLASHIQSGNQEFQAALRNLTHILITRGAEAAIRDGPRESSRTTRCAAPLRSVP